MLKLLQHLQYRYYEQNIYIISQHLKFTRCQTPNCWNRCFWMAKIAYYYKTFHKFTSNEHLRNSSPKHATSRISFAHSSSGANPRHQPRVDYRSFGMRKLSHIYFWIVKLNWKLANNSFRPEAWEFFPQSFSVASKQPQKKDNNKKAYVVLVANETVFALWCWLLAISIGFSTCLNYLLATNKIEIIWNTENTDCNLVKNNAFN